VTDVNNRLENLERGSGNEATDSAVSSKKNGQQGHEDDLAALKSGFNNLQKSFDVLRKKFEYSEDIILLLRIEVSHIKDRLGDSEEEFAHSESEENSDSSDHAIL
jgi:predicted  nucleic acid-binding Zn-ribbon protein